MICIKDLVDSKIFRKPSCRQILLPVFCRQIKDKLESKEEVCEIIIIISTVYVLIKLLKLRKQITNILHEK